LPLENNIPSKNQDIPTVILKKFLAFSWCNF
jgi:hypothetical protein